uniref:Uncharacterized protein n=1 Tax=Amphimedon queenslandica TaxID=400682 RepID=A0A1X7TQC4_AMPQE
GAVIHLCHVRYRPRAVPNNTSSILLWAPDDNMAVSSEAASNSIYPYFSHFLVSYTSSHLTPYDICWTHPLITWPSGRQGHLIRELNQHSNLSNVFIFVGDNNNVHYGTYSLMILGLCILVY